MKLKAAPGSTTEPDLDFVQIDQQLVDQAVKALDAAKRRRLKVVTAESCTGGLIATVLTEAPGAAEYFDGGFITYTPEHKCLALGLDEALIEGYGAVSSEVAVAMAEGALKCSAADLAIAVTGVAGPDTDERGNPVGLVYLAGARRDLTAIFIERKFGDIGRGRIRYAAASEALALLTRIARPLV
jgi:nicotinamide-nucleotide amidase